MQHSRLFLSYVETCFQKFHAAHEEYYHSGQVKSLFKMRVTIKKLRASLKCIEYYYGEKKFKKARKQLKVIFMTGGYLRELKKYREWLKLHSLLRVAKMIDLDTSIHKSEVEFREIKDKINSSMQEIKKHITDYARKLTQEKIYLFYLALIEERLHLLYSQTKKNSLHAFRKELKRIIYARHWQDEKGMLIVSERQAAFLNQYQHLIGSWHDHKEMGEWLRTQKLKHVGRQITPEQKAGFERAFEIIDDTVDRLYQKVIAKQKSCSVVMQPLRKRMAAARK